MPLIFRDASFARNWGRATTPRLRWAMGFPGDDEEKERERELFPRFCVDGALSPLASFGLSRTFFPRFPPLSFAQLSSFEA